MKTYRVPCKGPVELKGVFLDINANHFIMWLTVANGANLEKISVVLIVSYDLNFTVKMLFFFLNF